jgi:hypothetical protein
MNLFYWQAIINLILLLQYMNKEEIITAAKKSFDEFTKCIEAIEELAFFTRPSAEKWSVAEHVQHLVISTNITTLAYTLPAFIVRWVGGTPNRPSRSYEALVEKYQQKLSAGGRASGRFVPKQMTQNDSKEKLVQNWKKAAEKFMNALKNTRHESKLDDYLARHPLLGRITLRELGYFTIYHTEHHMQIIHQTTNPKPEATK